MTDENKHLHPRTDRPIELPNEKQIDESIANRREHSLDRPQTKFEAPSPWPEPKEDKGNDKKD